MQMPERPPGVPEAARWDKGDREWVLADTDAKGREHGLVTYWRPDGTLVNHCHYKHGTPHGLAVRYHESGEVSRRCVFVMGVITGTDACYRSAAPTTELAFPADRMPDTVWRYEVEWVDGRVVTARFYDRMGKQVTETGEALPDRPDSVPADAVYLSRTATWLHGHTDNAGKHHGLWRSWSREGVPTGEKEMDHGEEVVTRTFANADDAAATEALREGRLDEAVAAARRWWTQGDDPILAGELLGRCLDARPDADRTEIRATYTRVADSPGVAWHSGDARGAESGFQFTDHGRRSYQAQGAALDWLARDALAHEQAEAAIGFADRAIATEQHRHSSTGGLTPARAVKAIALLRLGRAHEAYDVARDALAADPELAGLDEITADPAFAAWLASVSTESMTVEGAWDVVGRRGERLLVMAQLMPAEESTVDGANGLDVAWPLREVLGDRLSPELAVWLDAAEHRPTMRPGVSSTVAAAVDAEDGTWLARLQGLFLPVSAVVVDDEEIRHAAWVAGPEGTSTVYYTHQDEPGFWYEHPSLASLLGGLLVRGNEGPRQRWERAVELLARGEAPPMPAHLDVAALYPRTGWLTHHLTTVELAEGLPEAPGLDVWERERELVPHWPHLQAYWLLHHLIFDNRELLPYLVEHADRRHPAVGELARLAEAVLGGGQPGAAWWNPERIRGLRTVARDTGHYRVMSPPSRGRLEAELSVVDSAADEMTAARSALATAPGATEIFELWDLLAETAGSLKAAEQAMIDSVARDQDEEMTFVSRQYTGELALSVGILSTLAKQPIGQAWSAFFDPAVRRAAPYSEEHANAVPGAITGLGIAIGDFDAFLARLDQVIPRATLGRRRRAEVAVVANQRYPHPSARAFLIGEATRFAAQVAAATWTYDTVSYALLRLMDLEPATAGPLVTRALDGTSFSGANWNSALRLVTRCDEVVIPQAAPGLLAALDGRLGRHDDGSRAQLTTAYARCAGPDAAGPLAERLDRITDVRAECERAALLAGLVTAAPAEPRWRDDARATLERMLAERMGSMEIGAAISLLRALHDVGGFGDLAQRVLGRAKEEKHTRAALLAWLAGTT